MKTNVLITAALLAAAACAEGSEGARQALLRRVFGRGATLDPKLVAKVKALPPGKRLLVDRNGDGKNDEAWFLDTAGRHTVRPLLVRAIDEDGDLDACGGPDLDSDLYLADWRADGTIDAAIDYQDNDGDQDVDEMGIYYFVGSKRDTLLCWWGADVGDDNLLWYDVNWTYSQARCQYRCHFSGDEIFCAFHLRKDWDRWHAVWENPFVFYDTDADGASEVVARFQGRNDELTSLRYSVDADGDACGQRPYDYDFSITAISGGHPSLGGESAAGARVTLTDGVAASRKLRGIPTHRVLRWTAAREFAQAAPWARACLTWDEINANTEGNVRRDGHERWEGLITAGSKQFPQIGGPACSRYNKRFEVSLRPARPLRLYHDATDHRLHLLGAGEGWLDVDYDLDGKVDARYRWADDDNDGIFDRRRIDLDADGRAELSWPMTGKGVRKLTLDYAGLSALYRRELTWVLARSQAFIDAAKSALGGRRRKADPVETFFLTKLPAWSRRTRLGHRIRSTPAGARFYMDLLRDRLFHALKQTRGRHPRWAELESHYAAGRYGAAAKLAAGLRADAATSSPARFQAYTRRIPIRIDNTPGPPRRNWPVALRVAALRAAAKDFNPHNCAVVAPQRWIDWRELPHQLDQIDPAVGEEISFLVDVPAGQSRTFAVYYTPAGRRAKVFAPRTAVAKGVAQEVGWESTRVAYRARHGRFAFFGKRQYQHSRPVEWLVYPKDPKLVSQVNDPKQGPWGIDALSVGETDGLGGLTLYVADRAIPMYGPGEKAAVRFTHRPLVAGPVRAAVEITAAAAEAKLRLLCIIYAERQDSEIRVRADAEQPGRQLAVGLVRLDRERSFIDRPLGCLGTWGRQEQGVGDIALGLIVPARKLKDVLELPRRRRLRCDFSTGRLRYWIIGDWRRGRRFPVAPTLDNWRRELRALAARLHRDVRVTLGAAQTLDASKN